MAKEFSEINPEQQKSPTDTKFNAFFRALSDPTRYLRIASEYLYTEGFLRTLENTRGFLVNPSSADGANTMASNMEGKPIEPILTPENTDPTTYAVLSNSGNVYDGALAAFVINSGLSLVDSGIRATTGRSIPERARTTASVLLSSAAVVANETGVYFQVGTADEKDIPAGILGALSYAGARYLIRRFIR